MKHAVRHIHFVGIGGSGMSGIAEVLFNLGYIISGSDLNDSATLKRLSSLGIQTCVGHTAANVDGADAVVTSTAVQADNPEVLAAREKRIPVVPRALMLAELMRLKQGIAIAGTHGKTTTTSLVASVLVEAGADPSFLIGGELVSTGGNARLGQGEAIVVEADESDASFLQLAPQISVVTNIDADHMETYGHQIERLHEAFVAFIHRLPASGRAVLCSDDAGVRTIQPALERALRTYGLAAGAQLRAVQVQALAGGRMQFVARQADHADLPVTLNLAGVHNVRNALAALAVARELGLSEAAVVRALAVFAGVGRRFQRYGELRSSDGGRFTLIDDYGHHPVEIDAVIAAVRGAFPGRRLVLAFQPHRYTRTRDCFDDFVAVLGRADEVLLTEVYAAGEALIAGASGAELAHALQWAPQRAGREAPRFVGGVDALPAAIQLLARGGDVVLTMGAGSIGATPQRVVQLCGVAA